MTSTANAAVTLPEQPDFSDRLSPIIVKELRQGLRTRVFVSLFIAVQALMTLLVVLSLVAAANGTDPSVSNGFFWAIIGLTVLFVLPLRGLGTVSNEMKSGTLELMLLTRLGARRIIVGKWLAIVAQTALFVCAVLPYLVLRYFLGGVNLADELVGIGVMLLASAMLTALAVGISPFQNRLTKVLLPIGIILFAQTLPFIFFLRVSSGVTSSGPSLSGFGPWLGVLGFGVLLTALMLEAGAAKIAPEGENHAAGKRLGGLLFLVLGGVFAVVGSPIAPGIIIAGFVIGCIVVAGALNEPACWNVGIIRPFAERGPAGRMAGRLFYPGWPAGVRYSIAFFALAAWVFLLGGLFDVRLGGLFGGSMGLVIFAATGAALTLPAALTRAALPNTTRALTIYVSVQTACLLLAVVVRILDNIFSSDLAKPAALLPTSGLIMMLLKDFEFADATDFSVGYGVIWGGSILVLLGRSHSAWKRTSELEKESPRPSADAPVA